MSRCLECDGSGWFSPTPASQNGWKCFLCLGTGVMQAAVTEKEIAEEEAREEVLNNGQFGVGG